MSKEVILKFKNGSGGTYNYDALVNKPKINGVEVAGELTGEDLSLQNLLISGENITIEDNGDGTATISSDDGGTVDQHYNPTSTNAQSGTAVAEAVADKADASGVYTKTEADALLDDKADAADVYTKSEVDNLIPDVSDFVTDAELATGLATKADASTTYTKSEVDALIPDVSDFVTDTEFATGLATKADAATTYTKTEVDNLIPDVSGFATQTDLADGLALKADKSDTYTEAETDALLAEKAALKVSTISTAGGGDEVHATISQETNAVNINYYKDGSTLPDYVNLSVDGDEFSFPTSGHVDDRIADVVNAVPFIATYEQTAYEDVTAAIDADRAIVVNFANNRNLICVTYATYTAGQNVTMSGIYKYGSGVSLAEITLTPENAWSIAHTWMQDKLVSGTNIKTINGQSLLGAGNLDIGGGGGGVSIVERGVTTFPELASVLNSGNVIIVKDGVNNHLVIQTSAIPLPESQKNILLDCGTLNGTGVVSSHHYIIDKLSDQWTRYDLVYEGATQSYVDGITGDLSTLTTDNKTNLVSAINEVYEKSGEPFRIKNWANNALNVTIVPCTSDAGNTSLAKMVYTINDVEGADYQIVGMLAYEVFDAASGGNRINCWPVCQFTGNGQKELSVRWMCGGTTNKVAKRINAWVLLKHR